MPPREEVAEYYYHKILADMIEEVLRKPSGRVRVSELAASAGFSRFHLTRLFHTSAEETLELFLRRMRLERAAYLLLNSERKVHQVAVECGYRSPEAFSRAFRRAFGCLPTEAKLRLDDWEIESTTDLHWNADWVSENHSSEFDDRILAVPTRYACVARTVGDYAQLESGWRQLETEQQIPRDRRFITIYLDNLWTHPVCRTLKADIGWLCGADEVIPRGMRKTVIPGEIAITPRLELWIEPSAPRLGAPCVGRYSRPGRDRGRSIAYDEYEAWPLPFEAVKTRILIGLNLDREKSAQILAT